VLRISSRHNPIVARFRAAARGDTADLILLDGPHLVAEAEAADIPLVTIAVAADAAARADVSALLDRLSRRELEIVSVTAPVLDLLSPVRSASGIVALARRPATDAARVFTGSTPLVAIAVDVQDPGNVGAIVRVAEAAGATGVLTTAASADPFGWKALRGSMGSALRLPLARSTSAIDAIKTARERGCRIAATVPRGGASLFETRFTGPLAVLIGGEGPGLSPALIEAADERIKIPMQPPVESLNAAVTAALVLYEARRQRAVTGIPESRFEFKLDEGRPSDAHHEL
jgi:TrmH family RNA methyltransferase